MRYVLLGFYLGLAGIAFAQTDLAGLGVHAVDVALVRNFTLTERARAQFRTETYGSLSATDPATAKRFVSASQLGSNGEAVLPRTSIDL